MRLCSALKAASTPFADNAASERGNIALRHFNPSIVSKRHVAENARSRLPAVCLANAPASGACAGA
jgi:hypothetical protein